MTYFQSFRRATVVYSRADGSAYLSVTAPLEVPPAGAFFGLPSEYFTTEYWKNRIGSELAFVIERADYEWWNLGLSFHFCFANDSAEIKNAVIQQNKFNLNKLIAYLQKAQAEQVTPEFAIAKIRANPTFVEFVDDNKQLSNINIAPHLADAIKRFYVENGRLPERIFSDYSGDPRLPGPSFDSDEYGIRCPTWAAMVFFSFPNNGFVKLTDNGPVFVNEKIYNAFRAMFWDVVAPQTNLYHPDKIEYDKTGSSISWRYVPGDYVGGRLVKIEQTAEFARLSVGYNADNETSIFYASTPKRIPSALAVKLGSFYASELSKAEREAEKAENIGALFSIIGLVSTILGLPALLQSVGSLFAGNLTFTNVLSAVKLADKIGIIEADKILAVTNLGDAVYGLSQSAIDAINPATFTESAELDDAVSVDYTPPDLEGTDMDEIDWDAWLEDQDSLLVDAGYESWFNLDDWDLGASFGTLADWGLPTDFVFDPEQMNFDTELAAADLSINTPDLTPEQIAVVNNFDEQSRLDTLKVDDEAKKLAATGSTDYLTALKKLAENVMGTSKVAVGLYVKYKELEAFIAKKGNTVPQTPRVPTKPTKPGQIVRQPDGSVSVMLPNGQIRTVKPDGTAAITNAAEPLPAFVNTSKDTKTLLLIGGAALSVGALVYLATSKQGK